MLMVPTLPLPPQLISSQTQTWGLAPFPQELGALNVMPF